MDAQAVMAEINLHYDEGNIICIPAGDPNPQEIVYEAPRTHGLEQSEAVAFIDRSAPHVHRVTTEVYVVVRGKLKLYLNGVCHTLEEGDAAIVRPGIIHWAEGDATKVLVYASPPWNQNDHILAPS